MFSNTFTFVIVAALATGGLAQAPSCFSGGNTQAVDCAPRATEFCNSLDGISVGAGQSIGRCQLGNNHRCDFIGFNGGSAAASFSSADCRTTLFAILNACNGGGGSGKASTSATFRYSIDPNDGVCGDSVTKGT